MRHGRAVRVDRTQISVDPRRKDVGRDQLCVVDEAAMSVAERQRELIAERVVDEQQELDDAVGRVAVLVVGVQQQSSGRRAHVLQHQLSTSIVTRVRTKA